MTATDQSPVEAAAEALDRNGVHCSRFSIVDTVLTAALAGDWLDREIERHSDASTHLDAWVCTSCGAALNVVSPGPGTLEDRVAAGVIAHQAAAIRAAMSGYGL